MTDSSIVCLPDAFGLIVQYHRISHGRTGCLRTEFRSGHHDVGRELYMQTIAEAMDEKDFSITALAFTNLAREEALIGNREEANKILAGVKEVIQRSDKQLILKAELAAAERAVA